MLPAQDADRAGRSSSTGSARRVRSAAFPIPEESPYDLFAVGHAGTAISTAVGMARGDEHLDRQATMSSPSSAMRRSSTASPFEGLNNAGTLKRQLLIVLNDNGMSISQPQGAFGHYLERMRVSTTYDEFKKISQNDRPPAAHRASASASRSMWQHFKEGVKSTFWPGQIFEAMGIKYIGPIDGHDLPGLINMLARSSTCRCAGAAAREDGQGQGLRDRRQRADQVPHPQRRSRSTAAGSR